jgi:hypothetical protein
MPGVSIGANGLNAVPPAWQPLPETPAILAAAAAVAAGAGTAYCIL